MYLSELSLKLGLKLIGADKNINAMNALDLANENELSYVQNSKYQDKIKTTNAGALIIQKDLASLVKDNVCVLISENPHLDFARASYFFKNELILKNGNEPEISDLAVIGKNVSFGKNTIIEKNVTIMSGVFIGDNVKIGEGSIIHPNAVIYNDTKIGKNCHIQANAVIGSDGFGYAHTKTGEHIKIYHNGNVILEDNVEIGACTTIDRAVFASTIIKKGTKIDNLVQIGHNCELGENCIIVSQVGISGSSMLGRNVVMGGQSGTAGHLKIGDFAQIAARGGVTKSIEGGKTYGGMPAILQRDWLRIQAKISNLLKKDK